MLVKRIAKTLLVASCSIVFTACSMVGGGEAKDEKGHGQGQQKQDGQQKAQSSGDTGKASVIDQELKKQYDMYKEILQYQIEQDKKVIKQSEERYQKLKEESDKTTETEEKKTGDTSDNKTAAAKSNKKTSNTNAKSKSSQQKETNEK